MRLLKIFLLLFLSPFLAVAGGMCIELIFLNNIFLVLLIPWVAGVFYYHAVFIRGILPMQIVGALFACAFPLDSYMAHLSKVPTAAANGAGAMGTQVEPNPVSSALFVAVAIGYMIVVAQPRVFNAMLSLVTTKVPE